MSTHLFGFFSFLVYFRSNNNKFSDWIYNNIFKNVPKKKIEKARENKKVKPTRKYGEDTHATMLSVWNAECVRVARADSFSGIRPNENLNQNKTK